MQRLVVVVACALVLAGCGGDPKADPSPAPSSPTTSASPTPTAPAMPEAAKANTKAGAVAFVKYYIDLLNFVQATGDETRLLEVSQPNCRSCKAVVDFANSVYDAGGHIEGGVWTIRDTHASNPTNAVWSVRVSGRIEPSTVVNSRTSPSKGTGGKADAEFVVIFNRAWQVVQWQTV